MRRRWIDPQDFSDLRKQSGLTRRQAAEALDVTPRTLPTNYVQGVFDAPSLSSPDYYAMRVAMTILQSLISYICACADEKG